jgi:hypothetical protein
MTRGARLVFPVWVFRRGAEAGDDAVFWFNVFGRPSPDRRQKIEIRSVLERLRRDIRAGRIPLGGAAVGWGGASGARPPHAADTSNSVVMRPWYSRAFTVVLSCDEISEPARVAAGLGSEES